VEPSDLRAQVVVDHRDLTSRWISTSLRRPSPSARRRSDCEPADRATALDASRLVDRVRHGTLVVVIISFGLDARIYERGQVRGSMIHHASRSTRSVGSLSIAMIEPAFDAPLVTTTRCSLALATAGSAALVAAVPPLPITGRADVEHPTALRPPADHCTSGELHSRARSRRKLDVPRVLMRSRLPARTKRGGLRTCSVWGPPFSSTRPSFATPSRRSSSRFRRRHDGTATSKFPRFSATVHKADGTSGGPEAAA
jgi:hypothetical protein